MVWQEFHRYQQLKLQGPKRRHAAKEGAMEFALYASAAAALVAAVVVDLNRKIIPNALIACLLALRLIAVGLSALELIDQGSWGMSAFLDSALASLAFTFLVFATALVAGKMEKKEALGMGDVKLYAVCMLWFAPASSFLFLFLSSLFGIALALAYHAIMKETSFPFAPAIALAFFVTLMTDFFWL